ncbi:MAG: outer membrane lipoprotein-sorting protein [candidate division KSB1 bacterium]|nr:outer membrane lipoprotein-sorting protein [candidate division KSB1 bacterium]
MSPAEVRGVSFLRRAEDRLYLYLPAFRRIRRIASSIKNERFMGTDFTYEDMSQSEFSKDYFAERLPDQDGLFVLQLTPRPDADVSYGRLVVYADSTNYVYRKVEYYDREGRVQKELILSDIERVDGYWVPKTMEMRDLSRNHKTLLELLEVRFDQGLSNKFFTQRNLKRPER